MAITCCICGRKQSGWIVDYPLSLELNDYRICKECGERYQKIQSAETLEDVSEELTYIRDQLSKGAQDETVKEFFELVFDKDNSEKTLDDIDAAIKKQRDEAIGSVMVTSGYNFEGYKITHYHDYISTETVLGMGAIKSLYATASNVVGIESEALNSKINDAKTKVIYDIRKKALELGANAIIGIDIDFTMFVETMVAVVASGTAVSIEKCE